MLGNIISILFDAKNPSTQSNERKFGGRSRNGNKIPFDYKIAHKEKDFRNLAVPHPKSQIELISFYDEFKELIIYYSKQSPYSIRKPDSVARFIYSKDNILKSNQGNDSGLIEEEYKEYKSLKTFFAYKKFSNIYKFYEHYDYHRVEKKYAKMFKFDISKCFDSIYTHSLAWALYNKDFAKQNLGGTRTFADKFDVFMQNTNYGETNGIIIGPEFSRIFAELILQSIDKQVEQKLLEKKIIHRVNYQIFRYVDDFFVFYNDDKTKKEILEIYQVLLKKFKMGLNDAKTIHYEKPLITEITIAKNKIVNLFNQEVKFKIIPDDEKENKEKFEVKKECNEKTEKKVKVSDIDIRCNANKLITEFKTIISTTGVAYKDVMNYTLVAVYKRLEISIKKYKEHKKILEKEKQENQLTTDEITMLSNQEKNFTKYILELLDFAFFLYNVSPRVNTTIKLVKISALIVDTYKKRYKYYIDKKEKKYKLIPQFEAINKELVFKKISDEITLVLDKSKIEEYIQIETLYLLITLKELGRDYRLTTEQLVKYLKLVELKNEEGKNYHDKRYVFLNDINYFVITVLLFYFKDIQQYKGLQVCVKNAIRKKIRSIDKPDRAKYSEFVLLLFDLLACPYLKEHDNKFKKEILQLFGIPVNERNGFISFVENQKYWFTKWDKFSLIDELNTKSTSESYS